MNIKLSDSLYKLKVSNDEFYYFAIKDNDTAVFDGAVNGKTYHFTLKYSALLELLDTKQFDVIIDMINSIIKAN